MKSSESPSTGQPIHISPEVEAKCEGPNQFQKFDAFFRSIIAVPKAAIDKEEARQKKRKEKQKR